MGSVISLPITMAANCGCSLFGSCCATMTCKMLCTNFLMSPKHSSFTYCFIVAIFVIFSLTTEYHGGDVVLGGRAKNEFLEDFYKTEQILIESAHADTCPEKYYNGVVICCEDTCSGVFSVYRFSFSLFCFSLTMLVLTFTKTVFSMKVHCGYWITKILVIIILVVSTLFIDNSNFIFYREFSRYMSIPFLFLQIVMLIDFAYNCNEMCVKLDEKLDKPVVYKIFILVISIVLYIICARTLVFLLVNLDNTDILPKNLTYMTMIFILLTTGLSMSKIAPHGTFFTSAVVSSYTTYLCYSSVSYYYKISNNYNSGLDLVLGLLFTSVSMASMTWTMTESQEVLIGKNTLIEEDYDNKVNERNEKKSWKYFHFMMTTCSLYMCMHLTNWSSDKTNNSILLNDNSSFFVKVCSEISCFTLYIWTLTAPYFFRYNRDFGVVFS